MPSQPENDDRPSAGFSIARLRIAAVVVLTLAVLSFTGLVFVLLQSVFESVGPAVQADLAWKTRRGAKELAQSADLGLAIGDAAIVREAFGDFAASDDVVAIVAVDGDGAEIARHRGRGLDSAALFAGPGGAPGARCATRPTPCRCGPPRRSKVRLSARSRW